MYDDETYLSGTSSCSSEILVPRISQTFDTHSRLPPITSFETRDDLVRYCKDYAKTNGYMLSISNSVPSRNVILVCDRAGFQRRRVDRSEPQKEPQVLKLDVNLRSTASRKRINGLLKYQKIVNPIIMRLQTL